jgi:hypothetical protein
MVKDQIAGGKTKPLVRIQPGTIYTNAGECDGSTLGS